MYDHVSFTRFPSPLPDESLSFPDARKAGSLLPAFTCETNLQAGVRADPSTDRCTSRPAAPPVLEGWRVRSVYNGAALNSDESAYDFMGRYFYVRLSQLF